VVSVAPRPLFSPRERTTGTHWTGGWVGPTAGLDTEIRGKNLLRSAGDRTSITPSSRHYTDWPPATHILASVDMKFRNKKKFWCGIPTYTGPFRALPTRRRRSVVSARY
jgi:hypothetical protein